LQLLKEDKPVDAILIADRLTLTQLTIAFFVSEHKERRPHKEIPSNILTFAAGIFSGKKNLSMPFLLRTY
jgi:hypothetical protein